MRSLWQTWARSTSGRRITQTLNIGFHRSGYLQARSPPIHWHINSPVPSEPPEPYKSCWSLLCLAPLPILSSLLPLGEVLDGPVHPFMGFRADHKHLMWWVICAEPLLNLSRNVACLSSTRARPFHTISVLVPHLDVFTPWTGPRRSAGAISRAFTNFILMSVYKTRGRPAAKATATGGVHVTDRKSTPRDRRDGRRPRRPVEACARTRAAGKRDVYEHCSSSRPARLSGYHG
jgi:hypothetical protein